jgi:hypothetical protein
MAKAARALRTDHRGSAVIRIHPRSVAQKSSEATGPIAAIRPAITMTVWLEDIWSSVTALLQGAEPQNRDT